MDHFVTRSDVSPPLALTGVGIFSAKPEIPLLGGVRGGSGQAKAVKFSCQMGCHCERSEAISP
jgi:hypothetical protein